MTDFNPNLHPRGNPKNAGQYRATEHTGPENDVSKSLTGPAWIDDGITKLNATEMDTDTSVGDTYDRSWSIRRDDGQIATRTVTWFVEEYDADSEDDENEEDGDSPTFSVWVSTTDTVGPELGGLDRETIEDPYAEDSLADDRVYESLGVAQHFAEKLANAASVDDHAKGWTGYPDGA